MNHRPITEKLSEEIPMEIRIQCVIIAGKID